MLNKLKGRQVALGRVPVTYAGLQDRKKPEPWSLARMRKQKAGLMAIGESRAKVDHEEKPGSAQVTGRAAGQKNFEVFSLQITRAGNAALRG